MVNELKSMIGMDETILYEGKPDKKCFLFDAYLCKFAEPNTENLT